MKNNNFYTFGMIKPDGMSHKEDIIKMIYDAGLEIPYTEFDYLSDELIEENYRHCLGKPFYEGMKKNLQSGAVLKMLIFDSEGDAVKKYRKVLGTTKSCEAAPDTIRGKFGDKNITYKKGMSVLEKYGENLTKKVYVTNPAIARDDEIEKTILTILTPDKSAILVGKAGVGKTAIAEGIAYKIQNNNVPNAIKGFEIIKVNTSSLLGKYITDNGTEELRINILLKEVEKSSNIILFIDEIHTLVIESRNSGIDFVNAMKPALSRGDVKVIGDTTIDEYNQYLIRDKAFLRRFEKIDVAEPDAETTVKILMGSYPRIEKKTGVKLAYSKFVIENNPPYRHVMYKRM
jgi:ATP-dependent Clp protease ATP-binding subunit ClpB